jgi:hypothetical protein
MRWIRGAYWLGAAYNVVAGLTVIVLGNSLIERFEIPPPAHPGYFEYPAFMLLVFGVLLAQIATNPVK